MLAKNSFAHIVVSVAVGTCLKSLSFHHVSGVRAGHTISLVQEVETTFLFIMLRILYVSTRYLQCFFLRASRLWHDPFDVPMAYDLMNCLWSPVVVAEQYLGSLAVAASHLILIWEPAGCGSMSEFVQTFPDRARTFRSSLYLLATGVRRRHGCSTNRRSTH